jgi:mannose-1-phosphate guanylyltransferase/mannose-6-phosphate isomerase
VSQHATHIVPAIMCGGSGTRLWPASRETFPKQFLRLLGERSTFQTAVQRVAAGDMFQTPLIVASHEIRFIIAEQLAEIGIAADNMLEPARRDSAAAVAVATCAAARRHPQALVLVVAADHLIDEAMPFWPPAAPPAAPPPKALS